MVKVGQYNHLKVIRIVDFGAYLDDGAEGILLPKRFMPENVKVGDELEVFVYHDSEGRLIATTQQPQGVAGDIVKLKCVSVTQQGAFLDMGLMKDIFVPRSKQLSVMRPNGEYLVKIYLDEKTGKLTATEKFAATLNNLDVVLKELEAVDLIVYRRTDIGYVVIINNQHTGVLHFSDIFKSIAIGDHLKGYIKNIYPNEKYPEKGWLMDVALGKPGYSRVEDESGKILRLLSENNGYLPYNDKSDPEAIYEFFEMSKKAFKMAVGNLYKQRKISLEKTGIRLI